MPSLGPTGSGPAATPAWLAEQITEIALHRIGAGSLAIASMPIAAVRCMALLRTPDFSMHDAADVIAADAVLAARVVSVSNSVAFGGAGKIRNLTQALTRLGVDNLRIVLFEATAAGVFSSNDGRIRDACIRLWEHSRAVAACSRHAANLVGAGDPGEAYLAGLLHDLGKPIVASMLLKSENRLFGGKTNVWLKPEIWLDIVQLSHRPVGIAVAERWNLPASVLDAIDKAGDLIEPISPMLDCVRFANALAKQQGIYVGRVDREALASFLGQGQELLGLDEMEVAELRSELQSTSKASSDAKPKKTTMTGH